MSGGGKSQEIGCLILAVILLVSAAIILLAFLAR